MKLLRLDEEAMNELEAAATWYETRRPGLGGELVAAVREALDRIASGPSL